MKKYMDAYWDVGLRPALFSYRWTMISISFAMICAIFGVTIKNTKTQSGNVVKYRRTFGYLAVASFALTAFKVANASTFEGTIEKIVFSAGQTPVRVSIFVASHTSPCDANYYAYENADTGLGKLWTSAALAAYATKKTVTIVGSGVCDPWRIEGVNSFVVQ